MTTRAKYAYSFLAGVIFWAGAFYGLGHRLLGWPPKDLVIGYVVLIAWLGVAGLAVYRGERIDDYRDRLRYRAAVAASLGLVGGCGLVAWALLSTSTTLAIVAVCEITAVVVTSAASWAAYKLSVRFRLGCRPGDTEYRRN